MTIAPRPNLTDHTIRVVRVFQAEPEQHFSIRQLALLTELKHDTTRQVVARLCHCRWLSKDRLGLRNERSDPYFVYALTRLGVAQARKALGDPPSDPSPEATMPRSKPGEPATTMI